MPPQIGRFISKAVYGDNLNSDPLHPIQDDVLACRFIDAGGKERKSGDSYEVFFLAFCHSFVNCEPEPSRM